MSLYTDTCTHVYPCMICVRCQFVHLLVSGNPVSNPSDEDVLNMCLPRMTKEQLRQVKNYKIELDTSPPVVCGGYMSYLRYLFLFVYNGVPHILCCVFCCCCLVWPVLPVSLDYPFDILQRLFAISRSNDHLVKVTYAWLYNINGTFYWSRNVKLLYKLHSLVHCIEQRDVKMSWKIN